MNDTERLVQDIIQFSSIYTSVSKRKFEKIEHDEKEKDIKIPPVEKISDYLDWLSSSRKEISSNKKENKFKRKKKKLQSPPKQ